MPFDHIIITTQDFPPSAGGIQTWCVELATNFSNLGYRVTVITKFYENVSEESFSYSGVEVIRLPHDGWKRKKNIIITKALKDVVTEKSILLASNWKMGIPAMLYNFKNKLPYFTVCHGLDAVEHRWKNKVLQKNTFKKSNGTIAVSRFTKKFMKENNITTPIDVINNGVNLDKFSIKSADNAIAAKYSINKDNFNIINIGRLEKRKGYDKTIEAIRDIPDVVFHIGGKGKYESNLKSIVEHYSLQDRVKFHGFIPDEDVKSLFYQTDLLVMPSRNIKDSVEGFGITYLEAAACGTPAIGSFNTGAEDAIENNKSGILVDGESTESIADAIKLVKNNPKKLEEMGNYAEARSKEFSWQIIAENYIDYFKSKV